VDKVLFRYCFIRKGHTPNAF